MGRGGNRFDEDAINMLASVATSRGATEEARPHNNNNNSSNNNSNNNTNGNYNYSNSLGAQPAVAVMQPPIAAPMYWPAPAPPQYQDMTHYPQGYLAYFHVQNQMRNLAQPPMQPAAGLPMQVQRHPGPAMPGMPKVFVHGHTGKWAPPNSMPMMVSTEPYRPGPHAFQATVSVSRPPASAGQMEGPRFPVKKAIVKKAIVKKDKPLRTCIKCHTHDTPKWRRTTPTSDQYMCNACGLCYVKSLARERKAQERAAAAGQGGGKSDAAAGSKAAEP